MNSYKGMDFSPPNPPIHRGANCEWNPWRKNMSGGSPPPWTGINHRRFSCWWISTFFSHRTTVLNEASIIFHHLPTSSNIFRDQDIAMWGNAVRHMDAFRRDTGDLIRPMVQVPGQKLGRRDVFSLKSRLHEALCEIYIYIHIYIYICDIYS